jgi:hypothetical protein
VPSFLAPVEALTRNDVENLPKTLATQKSRDVRLPYPAAWWLHLSGLQKAIRRGAVAEALDSAERLYHEDPVKVRRRLATIGLEDISFGDLAVVSAALMYAVTAEKQPSQQDLERCLGLVAQMAGSTKDRLVCELVGAACDPPTRRADILKIGNAGALECASLYRDEDADPRDRTLAALALAGSLKNVDGERIGTRDLKALVAAAMKMDLPDAVMLILESGLRLGGEVAALSAVLPVLYKEMREQIVRIERLPLPEAPLIGGVLAPAYDKHVHAGLRSLQRYGAGWRPLAEFLRKHVRDLVRDPHAIHTICFRAEGALLDREIVCPLGDEIFRLNEQAQAAALGLDYSLLPEAKRLFLEGLPILNDLRRQAIAAELRAHARGEK